MRKKNHALQRPFNADRSAPASDELIAVRLVRVDEEGRIFLEVPGEIAPIEAQTTVELTAEHVGRTVVIKLLKGRSATPIILGILRDAQAISRPPIRTLVDDELILSANRKIELRCGRSTLILHRDGKIELRGDSINSRATQSQKIRGGSVQIN